MNKSDEEKLRIFNFNHIAREAGQCDGWLRYNSGHEKLKEKLLPIYYSIIDALREYKEDA